MTHHYRRLILLLLGIIIGGYLIYVALIGPVIKIINLTPRPASTYSSLTLEEVCSMLKLDSNDPFCIESDQQNAVSLEAMLRRNFPIGSTSFDDIMPLLTNLRSRLAGTGTALDGAGFEPNGCQTSLSITYECYVDFPGEINIVTIVFAGGSNIIVKYGTTKEGT